MRCSIVILALLVTAAWGQEYPVSDQLYVSSREALELEALRKAIANARAKAEMIAVQFGVELGEVFRISEERIKTRPWPQLSYGLGLRGAGPLASETDVFVPRTITVKRRIYAVYELVSAAGE